MTTTSVHYVDYWGDLDPRTKSNALGILHSCDVRLTVQIFGSLRCRYKSREIAIPFPPSTSSDVKTVEISAKSILPGKTRGCSCTLL